MTPKDLISFYGSLAEVARATGTKLPSVCEWVEKGQVPEGRQYQIELATNGQLRASRPADRRKTA